jgi:hypothetical protein
MASDGTYFGSGPTVSLRRRHLRRTPLDPVTSLNLRGVNVFGCLIERLDTGGCV